MKGGCCGATSTFARCASWTALMYAAKKDNISAVESLILVGADINLKSNGIDKYGNYKHCESEFRISYNNKSYHLLKDIIEKTIYIMENKT